jgi:signal transduction histidine kinase
VAHDFNNLLTVMTGYAEMALDELPAGHSLRTPMNELSKAADRATSLTRQLLAFSRRQVSEPKALALDDALRDLEKIVRRLIGPDIELELTLSPEAGSIYADPGHIEQVIINLVVNARDAMPQGGRLLIETSRQVVDERFADRHISVAPGTYVMLAVSDTGVGMSTDVQAHIFEPFFTTKEQGKGTGLGLSTVYGIVKQSGGAIWVTANPDKAQLLRCCFRPRRRKQRPAPAHVSNPLPAERRRFWWPRMNPGCAHSCETH